MLNICIIGNIFVAWLLKNSKNF